MKQLEGKFEVFPMLN